MPLVNFRRLTDDAVVPKAAKPGDAGVDLVATSVILDNEHYLYFGTGVAVEIPEGYVGLIAARSNITTNLLMLGNGVGIIDSGYRGELQVRFKKLEYSLEAPYKVGDRVAQLLILPCLQIESVEAKELSASERGEGGFGSTGL